MDDCIHLHACRRVQKIGRTYGKRFPRKCQETCEAYESRNTKTDYITIRTAIEYARDVVSSIQGGYDSYDVYADFDLSGVNLGEILDSTYK